MLIWMTPLQSKVKAEALSTLLPGFLKRRADDVREIRKALMTEDFLLITTIGHKLRGNGSTFGFPDLSALGERLETAAKEHDHDAVLAEADTLEQRLVVLDLDLRVRNYPG